MNGSDVEKPQGECQATCVRHRLWELIPELINKLPSPPILHFLIFYLANDSSE